MISSSQIDNNPNTSQQMQIEEIISVSPIIQKQQKKYTALLQ